MTLTLLEALVLFGILGAFAGGFAFLFKTLISTKDERIKELVIERDYYRTASLFERELPAEFHPGALPPGTTALAVAPTPAVTQAPAKNKDEPSRFAYYSLLIQAIISIVVLILSFFLIVTPTDVTANQVAYQLISFVVGVWLGRGVDFATNSRK